MLIKSMSGTDGKVTLPSLGAVIAETFKWQLIFDERSKTHTLKANFKNLHEILWEEAGDARRIELRISKDKWYEARPTEGSTQSRNGRELSIKGIELCRLE